ncbi:MAG: thiol peroxidase [Marivirga sp.]|jgi:thiol peroxidase
MANITLGGAATTTNGELPAVNSAAPNFKLTKTDFSEVTLETYKGKKVILNIFPSVDTGVCAASVRKFNEEVANLENTVVLCVSKDLPFAQARFCGAEGIENAIPVSNFKSPDFATNYGVKIESGAFADLNARAVVIINAEGIVTYTELVPEIGSEPDYDKALKSL